MGKYSLEQFERVALAKCRPTVTGTRPAARFVTVTASQNKPAAVPAGGLPVLVRFDARESAACENALRATAAALCEEANVLGATLVSDAPMPRLWEAAAEVFGRLYVPVQDALQLDYALKRGLRFGLLAELGEAALDMCEAFAAQGAGRLWERGPVLVRAHTDTPLARRLAQQWHASATEGVSAQAGACIVLRRLTYPQALSSDGYAPLRFWWDNIGVSPLYEPTRTRLRLCMGETRCEIALHDAPALLPLGDRAHNEIARLPALPEGEYAVEVAVETREGALPLANEGFANGWLPVGTVRIDHVPRPQMETLWDDWYPEGYYPLEDPAQPNE